MIAAASAGPGARVAAPAEPRRAALAQTFLEWFAVEPARDWLEIDCGDGTWTEAILKSSAPRDLIALDADAARIDATRIRLDGRAVRLEVGVATALPLPHGTRDVVVGQLGFAGIEAASRPLAEILRVLRPEGRLGICIWDDVDEVAEPNEAPLPQLAALVRQAGFRDVTSMPLPAGPVSAWGLVARA